MKHIKNNKNALIVLHEIYGVNKFIEDICMQYVGEDFDIYSPNLLNKECYSYEQATEAYVNFVNEIGFQIYERINTFINILKEKYEKVFILGFSVGATIAWRCSVNDNCDGVIACYGSRIRDYLEVRPRCQVLLLFVKQDSFDVDAIIKKLSKINMVSYKKLNAYHGFMDTYSAHYDDEQARRGHSYIKEFLVENSSV
ncbi:dienelactone hydrolase family protein [Anaerosporobacter sp.]